ncbi:MAG: YqaA family protein [Bacteroidales bacterium]
MKISEKGIFFLKNLGKGLGWLVFLLLVFFFLKKNVGEHSLDPLASVLNRPWLILLIYVVSEVAFGIIPPEIFMLWGLRSSSPTAYAGWVGIFAMISYAAGMIGYAIGYTLQTTRFFRYVRRYRLRKYEAHLQKFGSMLVIVASMTPLPFSAICMLVGSARYFFPRFLVMALARFVRYGLYAYLIWEANVMVPA